MWSSSCVDRFIAPPIIHLTFFLFYKKWNQKTSLSLYDTMSNAQQIGQDFVNHYYSVFDAGKEARAQLANLYVCIYSTRYILFYDRIIRKLLVDLCLYHVIDALTLRNSLMNRFLLLMEKRLLELRLLSTS